MATGRTANFWSKIWYHQGVRLAWVAAAVLLIAGHLVISPVAGRIAAATDGSIRNQNVLDEYLVAMLRPTRISENVQPMMGMFAPAVTPTELAPEGNSL